MRTKSLDFIPLTERDFIKTFISVILWKSETLLMMINTPCVSENLRWVLKHFFNIAQSLFTVNYLLCLFDVFKWRIMIQRINHIVSISIVIIYVSKNNWKMNGATILRPFLQFWVVSYSRHVDARLHTKRATGEYR